MSLANVQSWRYRRTQQAKLAVRYPRCDCGFGVRRESVHPSRRNQSPLRILGFLETRNRLHTIKIVWSKICNWRLCALCTLSAACTMGYEILGRRIHPDRRASVVGSTMKHDECHIIEHNRNLRAPPLDSLPRWAYYLIVAIHTSLTYNANAQYLIALTTDSMFPSAKQYHRIQTIETQTIIGLS